jgi:acyl-CoA reductase-like NAD-dependent aldehyde dehydrogenase
LDRILDYVQVAKAEGLNILIGGDQWAEGELGKVYFFKPTRN